jgi:hypothetical protein
MNRIAQFARIAAIALTVAATGSAFADDITIDNTPAVSTKSRAEVRADLAQFQAGKTDPWSLQYTQAADFKSQLTREQVVAQLKAARASGELAALTPEA